MSDIIEHTSVRKIQAKSEDGKFYVKTTFFDDNSLEQNNKIRLSGMLEKAKLNLHENEDIRAAISCPSVQQWNIFKKKHADTYRLLNSREEVQRMKGVSELQLLHPDWIVYNRM